MRSTAYWPALDGMRSFAILLVIGGHSAFLPEISGPIGVTVFFVLSGFLITSVLLGREHGLIEFYGARAARLLPSIVTLVAVTGAVWWVQGRDERGFAEQAGSALFYVENFFPGRHAGAVLGHTWSLSVEEQFYLVWPFVLPLVMRLDPRRRAVALGALIAALALLRVALSFATSFDDFAYASLPTNAYAMLLGCTVAVLPTFVGARQLLAVLGVGVIAAIVATGASFPGGGITAPVVASTGALLLLLGAVQGNASLEHPAVRFVGRVSYSWYLWHWPLLWLAGTLYARFDSLPMIALSFVIATASTLYLEEPIRRWWRGRSRIPLSVPT